MAKQTELHPVDVIDEVLGAWTPGHFKAGRELASAAMLKVGINPPYEDSLLEALATDLIENDNRLQGEE